MPYLEWKEIERSTEKGQTWLLASRRAIIDDKEGFRTWWTSSFRGLLACLLHTFFFFNKIFKITKKNYGVYSKKFIMKQSEQLFLLTKFQYINNEIWPRTLSFKKKKKKTQKWDQKYINHLPRFSYLIYFYWRWILKNPPLDYIIFLYPRFLQNL